MSLVRTLAVALLALASAPAGATFHLVSIREVYLGPTTDANSQYVELQMYASGQTELEFHSLIFYGPTGNVLGASLAGMIGDLAGWRGVFGTLGLFGLVVALTAFIAFRGFKRPPPKPFSRAVIIANFRGILADPRAKVCFAAVFFEAIFVHGLFPYVAILLIASGELQDARTHAGATDFLRRRHRWGSADRAISPTSRFVLVRNRQGVCFAQEFFCRLAIEKPQTLRDFCFCLRMRQRLIEALCPGAKPLQISKQLELLQGDDVVVK